MKRLTAENRREICDKERECLSKKQELLRGGSRGTLKGGARGSPPRPSPGKSAMRPGYQFPQHAEAVAVGLPLAPLCAFTPDLMPSSSSPCKALLPRS